VIGAVVVLLAMLSLLTWQLVVLKDSRRHIAAQDAKITRLMRGTEPVLDRAEPLAGQAGRLLRSSLPLVRGARPVVEALRAFDTLRLGRVVNESGALLDDLARAGFLDRVLTAADLVPYIARIQAETLAVQKRSVDIQDTTLATQRRALRVLLRSLAFQREALIHVRSIDRKTGGPAPPAPTPLP
jgi:hypothetical protein